MLTIDGAGAVGRQDLALNDGVNVLAGRAGAPARDGTLADKGGELFGGADRDAHVLVVTPPNTRVSLFPWQRRL